MSCFILFCIIEPRAITFVTSTSSINVPLNFERMRKFWASLRTGQHVEDAVYCHLGTQTLVRQGLLKDQFIALGGYITGCVYLYYARRAGRYFGVKLLLCLRLANFCQILRVLLMKLTY